MPDADSPPPWWPHLLWVTAAAVLLDLGGIHHSHTADSLLPVLVSLYEWTPYYWEQNRYGMLVALLARPFDHPLTNLLVQNGITIWCGLITFPLAARYVLRHPSWAVAGPLAAATFVLIAPSHLAWCYFTTFNVFSTSMALGLVGLLAVEPRGGRWPALGRWLVAVGCFALAAWVNAAVGLLLLPVAALTAIARQRTAEADSAPGWRLRELGPAVGLTAFAVALATILQRLPPPEYRTTWLVVPPPAAWPGLLRQTAAKFADDVQPFVWLGFLGGTGAIAAARRRAAGGSAWLAVAVVAGVIAYAGLMGVLFKGRWRYATPGLVLIHTAVVAAAVHGLPWLTRRRAITIPFAAGLVVAAVVVRYGPPSVAGVREQLRSPANVHPRFADGLPVIASAKCTHVVGDYWTVWPAVFLTNLDAADRGGRPVVWGLSHRSTPTERHWRAVPPAATRIAAFADDVTVEQYLAKYGYRPARAEQHGPVVVYLLE